MRAASYARLRGAIHRGLLEYLARRRFRMRRHTLAHAGHNQPQQNHRRVGSEMFIARESLIESQQIGKRCDAARLEVSWGDAVPAVYKHLWPTALAILLAMAMLFSA